jgi:hypothetical protein
MTDVGVCESCGTAGEELALVRRYYVTPEAWDTAGKVEPAGEERWCFVCRTHYPHELLEGDDPGDTAAGANDAPS